MTRGAAGFRFSPLASGPAKATRLGGGLRRRSKEGHRHPLPANERGSETAAPRRRRTNATLAGRSSERPFVLSRAKPARIQAMPVAPELRTLDIDIPTPPEALVKLSLLLAEDDVNVAAMASLIEGEMALAAAVLRAVNSSLYGLKGRVQSVQQALTYLGMREVAAITFEFGLRAAFPPVPELEPVWKRAAQRGLLMGRMGQHLSVDPWGSHSAGLFEECGKAVLF